MRIKCNLKSISYGKIPLPTTLFTPPIKNFYSSETEELGTVHTIEFLSGFEFYIIVPPTQEPILYACKEARINKNKIELLFTNFNVQIPIISMIGEAKLVSEEKFDEEISKIIH